MSIREKLEGELEILQTTRDELRGISPGLEVLKLGILIAYILPFSWMARSELTYLWRKARSRIERF